MRKHHILLSALATLLLVGCHESKLGHERTHSFAEVEALFVEPGAEFRPAPFWVWNAKVTREDIDRMLPEFKEQGYGGVYIHPRPGMETEYLSQDWFDLWQYSLERGKELGLKVWIYDENSYPSGFAGGHVPAEFPESCNHAIDLIPTVVEQLPEDLSPYRLCLKQVGDKFVDITSEPRTDAVGRYILYTEEFFEKKAWHGGYSYVDLLYLGTTECFIDITMRGYEARFKDEFGKAIPGIFTDEPSIQPWTPALAEEFKRDWGYDLYTHLPMLSEEVGNWKQVRYHAMATKLRLFIERWAEPWHRYCEQNNLLWTGHYWEHEWSRAKRAPDNMAMYEYHQLPAIDILFNQFNEEAHNAHWGNVRIVKELRSAANQIGQTRTLSESYGGGGWEMTFKDYKRLADWKYALGVNYMNQHFSNVTIEGVRKFDYPNFFTSYAPWASNYKVLNDHTARLSLVLSQGEQYNDILVLEPTSTTWMYYTHHYHSKHLRTLVNNFQALVTTLNKQQVEFDIGCENIIRNRGEVKDGKFVVGERAYSTVIIPEMCETLFASTTTLLEEFVEEGGRLIALGQPTQADAYESEVLAKLWERQDIERELNIESLYGEAIRFEGIEGGNLQFHRRQYEDGELLFLANSSLDSSTKGRVTLNGVGLKVLDTYTGEIYRDTTAQVADNRVSLNFDLAPAGHLLVFAPKCASSLEGLAPYIAVESEGATAIEPKGEIKVRRIDDNYLTLDFCDLEVDGKRSRNLFVGNACRELFRHFDMENPWERAIQYKDNIISTDTLTRGDITVSYRFKVADRFDYSTIKFICEKPALWEVRINGERVTPIENCHPLDARNGCYDIGKYVRKGENVVTLHRSPMSIYAEISFAFITGDFAVVPDKVGWKIAAPQALKLGAWKSQGLPFFAWDVAYSNTYDLPKGGNKIVSLGDWEGTVCEVWVNDTKSGIIFTQPYELDITNAVKEGENEIEVRCTGSLFNLYGPHFTTPNGKVTPTHWYNNAKLSPASSYQLFGYGLDEEFKVLVK